MEPKGAFVKHNQLTQQLVQDIAQRFDVEPSLTAIQSLDHDTKVKITGYLTSRFATEGLREDWEPNVFGLVVDELIGLIGF